MEADRLARDLGLLVNTPGTRLLVAGLPPDISSERASSILACYGRINRCQVFRRATRASAAFVFPESIEDAMWMMNNLNGNIPIHLTTPITIAFAIERQH